MNENLKVNVAARLDYNAEIQRKIKNFTCALNELPCELEIKILVDGIDSDQGLKINLADLVIENVKKDFNI
jgi:hypothetical protein